MRISVPFSLLLAAAAWADDVEVEFKEAPLPQVLEWASKNSDPPLRFLYKDEVGAFRVNVLSPGPISRAEVLPFVRFVLASNGFVLAPYGEGTYEVVRDALAKWKPCRMVDPGELGGIADYERVSCVVRLAHADAREVDGALKLARVSDPNLGDIVGLTSSSTLLLSDYAANLRRLLEMVRLMDVPAEGAGAPLVRSLSLEVYLFGAGSFDASPRVATGDAARRIAAAAAERRAEAGFHGASGMVYDLEGRFQQNRFEATDATGGLEIDTTLVTTGPEGAPLGFPRLDLKVSLHQDHHLGSRHSVPASAPGEYAFVSAARWGEEIRTLVVVAKVE